MRNEGRWPKGAVTVALTQAQQGQMWDTSEADWARTLDEVSASLPAPLLQGPCMADDLANITWLMSQPAVLPMPTFPGCLAYDVEISVYREHAEAARHEGDKTQMNEAVRAFGQAWDARDSAYRAHRRALVS